jgi:hypothetical protein
MSNVHMTACEWRVGPPGLDELRIVERARPDDAGIDGFTLYYAVTRGGWVANKDREWEYEPQPSSRDDDFLERTRWRSWEDAALVAQYMAKTPSSWGNRRV